jgi:hypothetical protein
VKNLEVSLSSSSSHSWPIDFFSVTRFQFLFCRGKLWHHFLEWILLWEKLWVKRLRAFSLQNAILTSFVTLSMFSLVFTSSFFFRRFECFLKNPFSLPFTPLLDHLSCL